MTCRVSFKAMLTVIAVTAVAACKGSDLYSDSYADSWSYSNNDSEPGDLPEVTCEEVPYGEGCTYLEELRAEWTGFNDGMVVYWMVYDDAIIEDSCGLYNGNSLVGTTLTTELTEYEPDYAFELDLLADGVDIMTCALDHTDPNWPFDCGSFQQIDDGTAGITFFSSWTYVGNYAPNEDFRLLFSMDISCSD